MNTKRYLLNEQLLGMQLEALDFKNIEPYQISKGGVFRTENSLVAVDLEEIQPDTLDSMLKNRIITVTGEVFNQTLDFYKNKPGNHKVYNISFVVNGSEMQAKMTSYKEYIRILYTVFLYAKQFIEREKPLALFIFSSPKKEGESGDQKNLVYNHVVRAHLPTGYTYSEAAIRPSTQTRPGVVVYRKTLPNKK